MSAGSTAVEGERVFDRVTAGGHRLDGKECCKGPYPALSLQVTRAAPTEIRTRTPNFSLRYQAPEGSQTPQTFPGVSALSHGRCAQLDQRRRLHPGAAAAQAGAEATTEPAITRSQPDADAPRCAEK